MYKCEMCQESSKPGEPRRVHVLYKPSARHSGVEVAREVAVCELCEFELGSGRKTLDQLVAEHAPVVEVPEAPATAPPVVPPPPAGPVVVGRSVLKK